MAASVGLASPSPLPNAFHRSFLHNGHSLEPCGCQRCRLPAGSRGRLLISQDEVDEAEPQSSSLAFVGPALGTDAEVADTDDQHAVIAQKGTWGIT